MAMSRTVFDIASRYQSHPYDSNVVYIGEHTAASRLTAEIEYDRPYFNTPPIDGVFGNPVSFINIVKDFLKKQKFSYESNEILDVFFTQNPLENPDHFNFMDLSAHFIDFENHLKKVTIDDEDFYSLKKLTPEMSQLPEFLKITSVKIDQMISNNYDFSTTNIYGRNILSYIKDPLIMEKVLNHIDSFDYEDKFSILFNMDHFNSGPISQQTNLKNIALLLKSMNNVSIDQNIDKNIHKELANKYFFYENIFGITASSKFLQCMDKFFSPLVKSNSPLGNVDIKLLALDFIENLSLALHEISHLDSDFVDKVLHQYNENVKKLDFKALQNPSDVKLMRTTLLQLDYFLLRDDPSMQNNNPTVPRVKI